MHWKESVRRNRTVLWVVLFVSLTFGFQAWTDAEFENEVLSTIAQQIQKKSQGKSEEALIDSAIQLSFFLQERRSIVFGGHRFQSLKANYFKSSLQSFYIGVGACGYYSLFAARVFQKLGYQPKIIQQKVGNRWGAHITLAIPLKSTGQLVVVDPLFHHVFRDANGNMVGLEKLKSDWFTLEHTLPDNYNRKYNYQSGWRHTNWDKFGFVSRAVYKLLCWTYGKAKTDAICMRMYIIDPYRIQFQLAFGLSILAMVLLWITRQSVNAHKELDQFS